jgi:hypothetical protein
MRLFDRRRGVTMVSPLVGACAGTSSWDGEGAGGEGRSDE